MSTILIIDDDADLRDTLAEAIADLGHIPVAAADGAAGLARVGQGGIDAVLLDLRMPGMDGMRVLERLRTLPNPPPVAILTAVPNAENTIEAMRLGAVDHLAKPIGRADLAALIAGMLPEKAESEAAAPKGDKTTLVGNSASMRAVQKSIGRLADSDASVLITGETGTGKEVVARALHQHGRRRSKPFVALNCAAIPADLLESQLFGHVRGAFTGAVSDALGSFRAAQGGTLFLDEIGDMAPALQAKLLRVLEDRVVTPLGGKPMPVDVRIVSATHRDLAEAARAGKFREDLFYRLGVVPISLPPLRERLSDIVELAEYFLAQFSSPPRRLSAEAAARLLAHDWPGNVRELRNAMERVCALGQGKIVGVDELDFLHRRPNTASGPESGDLPSAVARLEQEMIRRALAESAGNRSEAARRLGIHRQRLHEKLRLYGLDLSGVRTGDVLDPDDSARDLTK